MSVNTLRLSINRTLSEEMEWHQESPMSEISSDNISIPKQYIHDRLNQQIWNGDVLRPEIREKLIKIANEFYKFLDIQAPIEAVKFLGSMANYNWSSQSDLDIHIFFNFSQINQDVKLVKNYLDAKKSIWNNKHNINIKGYSVELYCQNLDEINFSKGVYNLTENKWEQKPSLEHFEVDNSSVITKIISIASQIENFERNSHLSYQEIYNQGEDLKKRIKKMRQCGLEEGGEFSSENLAFKYLRNNGYIERLFTITREAYDHILSVT